MKYGPRGQTIKIMAASADDKVQIEVSDQGPGIPQSQREQVWAAFYRLPREQQTAISGTGIGLAVVRELVAAMGGRCWVADLSAGASIVLQLPGAHQNGQ